MLIKVIELVDIWLATELVPLTVHDVVRGVLGLELRAVTVVDSVMIAEASGSPLLTAKVEGSLAVLAQPHHLDITHVNVVSNQSLGPLSEVSPATARSIIFNKD